MRFQSIFYLERQIGLLFHIGRADDSHSDSALTNSVELPLLTSILEFVAATTSGLPRPSSCRFLIRSIEAAIPFHYLLCSSFGIPFSWDGRDDHSQPVISGLTRDSSILTSTIVPTPCYRILESFLPSQAPWI